VLPFTGLIGPHGVTVDAAGNLYVSDKMNNRG
jgi:DNA-binding beta-propeller fold protein YncE